jgi:hypothetical protein
MARDRRNALAYYKKNREARLAYGKRRREENRDRYNESRKAQRRIPKYRFGILRNNAKTRKLPLSLTFEEWSTLVSAGRCFYCSGPLPEAGGGLDRLDNRLGYTKENCVPCCGAGQNDCNGKKGVLEMIGFKYPRTVELLREVLNANEELDGKRIAS